MVQGLGLRMAKGLGFVLACSSLCLAELQSGWEEDRLRPEASALKGPIWVPC